jgi:hypothetical protein
MRAALVALLAAALGCATPIASTLYEAPQTGPVKRIAVLPLVMDPAAGVAAEASGAPIITARLVEALNEETSLEVIPPEDALRSGGGRRPNPGDLKRDFGVDAIVTGTVRRYSEREGSASGVTRPAAVWFELELRSVSGELLWSGVYEERQEALSDNFLTLGMAWKRGFRWVTAEDLAKYGARELARALAADTASWS